jgi:Neurotransmitter-gated ion-channel transmembrane region
MPDGSLYAIIRNQRRFSTKFQLAGYPFDTQFLTVAMEDTIASEDTQFYVPDPSGSLGLDPEITLPGFKVGKPEMRIVSNTYPTNFGDLAEPQGDTYSRVILSVPVARSLMAMSVKTFVPIVLIVICAALVFFVRPHYVEGRIGLGITALLTLVALQLTSSATLPDVDYLMMLDKIYLLAYVFIIAALARVVLTSWRRADDAAEKSITRADRIWVSVLLAAYIAANAAVVLPALV